MIDKTVHDKRITELEDKLKDHERRIAELKHELDDYKEKYSQLLRTRNETVGLFSVEVSPRKVGRLRGTDKALAQDAPAASQRAITEGVDLDGRTAQVLTLKKQIIEIQKAGEEVLKAAKWLSHRSAPGWQATTRGGLARNPTLAT
jgi:chromosome segregation ATPase